MKKRAPMFPWKRVFSQCYGLREIATQELEEPNNQPCMGIISQLTLFVKDFFEASRRLGKLPPGRGFDLGRRADGRTFLLLGCPAALRPPSAWAEGAGGLVGSEAAIGYNVG